MHSFGLPVASVGKATRKHWAFELLHAGWILISTSRMANRMLVTCSPKVRSASHVRSCVQFFPIKLWV